MQHIKRISRQLKYKGSLLEIYSDTICTTDGNTANWDFIKHDGAVAVLPILNDGRIVLVRQYRNALDRETLEIPAGGIECNETAYEAAMRELEEETGYKTDCLEMLISEVTAVAYCNETIPVYIARDLTKTQQHLDRDEFIEIEYYYPNEIKEMIFAGKIMDCKTIAAFMSYLIKEQHNM